jgi:hypothetical protein
MRFEHVHTVAVAAAQVAIARGSASCTIGRSQIDVPRGARARSHASARAKKRRDELQNSGTLFDRDEHSVVLGS